MLLKSIFDDLGKQYKLPTPLKRHMSGLALQGLKIRHLSSQNNSKKSEKQVSFPYDGGGHFLALRMC